MTLKKTMTDVSAVENVVFFEIKFSGLSYCDWPPDPLSSDVNQSILYSTQSV
jgi:hypothetical protein